MAIYSTYAAKGKRGVFMSANKVLKVVLVVLTALLTVAKAVDEEADLQD